MNAGRVRWKRKEEEGGGGTRKGKGTETHRRGKLVVQVVVQ